MLSDFMNNPKNPYVYGIRVYYKPGTFTPMADLALGDGGRPNGKIVTIHWDNETERSQYFANSYTFIWDERTQFLTKENETPENAQTYGYIKPIDSQFFKWISKGLTLLDFMRNVAIPDFEYVALCNAIYLTGASDEKMRRQKKARVFNCNYLPTSLNSIVFRNAEEILKEIQDLTSLGVYDIFKRNFYKDPYSS